MRILSVLFVMTLICTSSTPALAVATVVYIGSSFPIVTIPTNDFANLTPEERTAWLTERNRLLETLRTDLEALNGSDATDAVNQIKRDRSCATGWSATRYVVAFVAAGGAVVTSAAAGTVPTWLGYVVAGVGAVGIYLNKVADDYKNKAVAEAEEAVALYHQLQADYEQKKQADLERRRTDQLIFELQALAGANVDNLQGVITTLIQGRRVGAPVEIARPVEAAGARRPQPNLEAHRAVHGDIAGDDGMEAVARPGGRNPARADEAPANAVQGERVLVVFKTRKKKKGAQADAVPPLPVVVAENNQGGDVVIDMNNKGALPPEKEEDL